MFLGNLSHLHALKGVGNRPFSRWLTRDYRPLFPRLPERTRLFQQNPQSARRNNFPGEQISRRFLLLSEAIRKLIRSIAARSCSILAVMKHRATARSESVQHKRYVTDLDHSRTGLYTVLIVLTVSATPTLPGVRPLHHPAFLQGR